MKLVVLAAILIIIDITAGKVFSKVLNKMTGGLQAAITYSVKDADQQLIILGSSRAVQQYVPSIFTDTLHLSAYNAGAPGMTFLYYYCIYKCVLTRTTPKIIIVDILPFEFNKNAQHYTTLASLLPYYKSEPEIQPILNLRSPFEKYKTVSNLYCYNSILGPIIRDWHSKRSSLNGYFPTYDSLSSNQLGKVYEPQSTIDTTIVERFKEMVKDSKMRGCKLFVLVSPTYQKYDGETETIQIAKKICSENDVFFGDYSQNHYFLKRPEFFKNTFHLNNNGAVAYSEMLANEIKNNLSTPENGSSLTIAIAKHALHPINNN